MFAFLIVSLLLHESDGLPTQFFNKEGLLTTEVPFGETVQLQCRSNGDGYILDYWLYNNGKAIIGPSNSYDKLKYDYNILSGNLTIRSTTAGDEGLYSCVSKEVRGENIKVERIQVIVSYNWETVYEQDSGINTIRILIVLIVLVILGAGAFYLYRMWKDRYRYPSYLAQSEDEDEEDDDSAEEIFSAPSTSGHTQPLRNIVLEKSNTFDTISTDFKSILDTANDK